TSPVAAPTEATAPASATGMGVAVTRGTVLLAHAVRGGPDRPRAPHSKPLVDRDEQRDDQDRDDVRDLDHRVDRRPGGVLVGIADRVAGDGGSMCLRALAAVLAVLDRLLRVVPGATARGHRDREEEA